MALQKQSVPINFSQGLDLKTDPKQVAPGKFLALTNTVFDKGGLLQKRNGYAPLAALPDSASTFLTTFNGNLTAIGTSLEAYSAGSNAWVDKGETISVDLTTLPLIRSNTNQSYADIAIAADGLICTVFTDNVPSGSSTTPIYKYAIADSVTGQNVVSPTVITPTTGTVVNAPRVFFLGKYFIIVFDNLISGVNHLSYIAINSVNPTQVGATVSLSNVYTPTTTGSFDGVVTNNALYLVWNSTGGVRALFLQSTLQASNSVLFAGHQATIISITADNSPSTPILYTSFYNSATSTGFTLAFNHILQPVLAATSIITATTVSNVTSVANNGVATVIYEVVNFYGYDSSIQTDYLNTLTVTQAGTVSATAVLARSVGLASKAFIISGMIYCLTIYNSAFQPSYFLINETGKVTAKLAYSNGGSYYVTGLPNAQVTNNEVQIPYLIKDQIQAVNKTQGAANAAGIYSQTGINLTSFALGNTITAAAEIGDNLNLQGGYLIAYDGYSMVENGFFLWPDYVEATGAATGGFMSQQQYFYAATYEWSDNQGNIFRSAPSIPVGIDLTTVSPIAIIFTSTFSSGVSTITVSSATGLVVGQIITDTTTPANITAGTTITSIAGTSIGLSLPTAGSSAGGGDSLQTFNTNVYSVTVDVPTLRLTYKINNPVKIVLYRWSTAQQEYFQTSSIIVPTLNDPTVDYIAIVDKNSDASIQGNSILYTTGGVVENISPPASDTLALFQSRLFLVDAEDKNLLWFSKQVIESTPVEMSDLLTIYVAPTTAAQGSTGPLTALTALDDKLILFKKDAIYYINGTGPDNTGANSQFSEPIFITATVGCANQSSIVFTPQGLIFQSDKGMWVLGRDLSTSYIGAPVQDLTDNAVVQSAVNVPGTNQVRFTLNTGITLMYDYFYSQWGTFANVPAVSSTLYQGLHTYLNSMGAVFQETPGSYLDNSNPVLIGFTTGWFNLSGLQGYERAYFFYLLGTYISPHKLSISIAYDYNSSPTQVSVISPTNFSGTWGSEAQWGSSPAWGGNASLEQWRIFLKTQKCQSFQISLQESFDPTFGTTAGAGLTLSGIDLVVGMKSGYPRLRAAQSVG